MSGISYQFEKDNKKINLIDTPGLFDFAGGVSEGLTAADSAIIVLSGKSGLAVGAELTYDLAQSAGVPCAFFVGKFDSARAKFDVVLNQLKNKYGAAVCPLVVPVTQGEEVVAFADLIRKKAYRFDGGANWQEFDFVELDEVKNIHVQII